MLGRQRQRQRSAQAVPDDDRPVEVLGANVSDQFGAHRRQQRLGDRRHAGEAGEREHVASEAILIPRDGGLPRVTGRHQTGNQNHGPALAGHLDAKRRRRSGCRGRLRARDLPGKPRRNAHDRRHRGGSNSTDQDGHVESPPPDGMKRGATDRAPSDERSEDGMSVRRPDGYYPAPARRASHRASSFATIPRTSSSVTARPSRVPASTARRQNSLTSSVAPARSATDVLLQDRASCERHELHCFYRMMPAGATRETPPDST